MRNEHNHRLGLTLDPLVNKEKQSELFNCKSSEPSGAKKKTIIGDQKLSLPQMHMANMTVCTNENGPDFTTSAILMLCSMSIIYPVPFHSRCCIDKYKSLCITDDRHDIIAAFIVCRA